MNPPVNAESLAMRGSHSIAFIDSADPQLGRPLDIAFVTERLEQRDPRLLAIALRLAERVTPLTVNPYFIDENTGDGHRVVSLRIPFDDPEGVAYFDEIMASARADEAAEATDGDD